jgi:FKBP-type peptidyl-prolyl cis-trans isomerase
MKKSLLPAMLILCLAVLAACTMDEKLSTCVKQEESIESYIESKFADSTVVITDNGIARIVMVHGNGPAAQKGDSVLFSYKGYLFSKGPGAQFAEGRIKERLGDRHMIDGLDEGMVGMMRGEEAYIAFSARYGFFDKATGAVSPMTPLIYYVTLENIYR